MSSKTPKKDEGRFDDSAKPLFPDYSIPFSLRKEGSKAEKSPISTWLAGISLENSKQYPV
jgi:hypothetical protein